MEDVTETGELARVQVRPSKPGYTPFREGDVLLAKITPCLENGKGAHAAGLPTETGQGSTEFHVLRARPGVSSRFLYHWTRTAQLRQAAEAMMTGSAGQRRVPSEFFDRFLVPLFDLEEQRRIAEILDTIDQAIQATERLIAKLRHLRVALLADTVWAVEIAESVAVQAISQGDRGVVIGPFGSDLVATDYRADGVPVVFVQDIRNGEPVVHRSQVFVSEPKAKALAAHSIQPGDIAITKMGLPPGIASLYLGTMPPGVVTADVIRLRCNTRVCEPAWVVEAVNSPSFQAQVRAITGGVTRPKITLRDFRSMRVRLPQPSVQRKHLAVLRSLDSRLSAESAELKALVRLRQGLAADLLSGSVRTVPS
jgi:type I restriction enzyme S subunit